MGAVTPAKFEWHKPLEGDGYGLFLGVALVHELADVAADGLVG
jgi:hypothetical protein